MEQVCVVCIYVYVWIRVCVWIDTISFYIDNAMAEISMRNKFVIDADEVLLDNFVGIKQVYNWICH